MASSKMDRGAEDASGNTTIGAALIVNKEGGISNTIINGDVNIGKYGISIQDSAEKLARLCNTVNKKTHSTISAKITGNFKDENLIEPSFKVYPQMRKVKKFYKGGYEKEEDKIMADDSPLNQGSEQTISNETRKEIGFFYEGEQQGDETITKDEIVEKLLAPSNLRPQDKNPVTAVVASTGSGKTTLLYRIAEEVLNSCPIYENKDNLEVEESHVKMVYLMDMKRKRFKEKLKPAQFLFEGLYANDDDADKAYKWLLENENEAVLIFDGLDQATFTIDDESSQVELNPYQEGTASEIMCNILSRNLLPHVTIVIASRELRVAELPAKARPQDIISLVGFNREDAEKLFKALIEDGSKIWNKIKSLSPRLLNILSVPVFLILTASIMAQYPNQRPPTTITKLYDKILSSFGAVDTVQERRQIMEVIKKLKAMAHQGIVEGKLVFHKSDLTKFGLTDQDTRDLLIKVPGRNLFSYHLDAEDYEFYFCHQSLQEFFSASFVAEMTGRKFSEFIYRHLHESGWSVVRTFLSGIIHDKEADSKLHTVSDPDLKRQVFDEVILSQTRNHENGTSLLAAIYESNDGNLIRSLPRLPTLSGSRIGPNEAYMFGSILARRRGRKEKIVDWFNCGLTDENVNTIVENLTGSKIKVEDLYLRFNPFTAKGFNSLLAHFEADHVNIDYGRISEFRLGLIDWNNTRTISWGALESHNAKVRSRMFRTINKDDVIQITGDVEGKYSKKEKKLSLENQRDRVVLDFVIFFEQKRFAKTYDKYVYLTATQLANVKAEVKIKKILLDCRSNKKVDSSMIISRTRTLEITCLDFLVNYESTFHPPGFLDEAAKQLHGTKVNVHWWFKLVDGNDVEKLIRFVNKNQVKNIRLQCHAQISLEDIKTIIESCNLQHLSLLYWIDRYLSDDAYEAIRQSKKQLTDFAQDHGVVYDFKDPQEYTTVIPTAWQVSDRRRVA